MQHIHFIGIGGIGMSGIAQIMLKKGYKVSGSDLKKSNLTENLEAIGAKIYYNHNESNIDGADTVVYSTAISENNIEVQAAQKAGIQIIKRAEMLGFLMNGKNGTAVAGTHGKTTTSSMISYVFKKIGLNPTVIIGGELSAITSNASSGTDPYVIAEADESDASFLYLAPKIAVITSIDSDVNLNVRPWREYRDDTPLLMQKIRETFINFTDKVVDSGIVVLCEDNAEVRKIKSSIKRKIITYGITHEADLFATNIKLYDFKSSCDVYLKGEKIGTMNLNVPGKHNVQNALACIAVCMGYGFDVKEIIIALEKFGGLKRRFEVIGRPMGTMIVDDYAHNPSKIMSALHATKTGNAKRVIAVYQPHRYSRSKYEKEELSESFFEADKVIITDIYSAGEKPLEDISGKILTELTSKKCPNLDVTFIGNPQDAFDSLIDQVQEGDLIIALGAGDITNYVHDFCKNLENKKSKKEIHNVNYV
ncbi:UDP-N-acetylmuramate--L-alanine ligase [bacterium]|nr:UDP-N-acetylmuramate--L-alanine ligase [bacterium]